MKYYVGYFNKSWDKSEFTVICGCPDRDNACFILEQYQNFPTSIGCYSGRRYGFEVNFLSRNGP